MQGIVAPTNLDLVEALTLLVGTARYDEMKEIIANDPRVMRKDVAFDMIIAAAQEAFALGYRFPYWMYVLFLSRLSSFSHCIILLAPRITAHRR